MTDRIFKVMASVGVNTNSTAEYAVHVAEFKVKKVTKNSIFIQTELGNKVISNGKVGVIGSDTSNTHGYFSYRMWVTKPEDIESAKETVLKELAQRVRRNLQTAQLLVDAIKQNPSVKNWNL